MCKMAHEWRSGTIIALGYRENHWPLGQVAPYQVALTDGSLICVPWDIDSVCREINQLTTPTTSACKFRAMQLDSIPEAAAAQTGIPGAQPPQQETQEPRKETPREKEKPQKSQKEKPEQEFQEPPTPEPPQLEPQEPQEPRKEKPKLQEPHQPAATAQTGIPGTWAPSWAFLRGTAQVSPATPGAAQQEPRKVPMQLDPIPEAAAAQTGIPGAQPLQQETQEPQEPQKEQLPCQPAVTAQTYIPGAWTPSWAFLRGITQASPATPGAAQQEPRKETPREKEQHQKKSHKSQKEPPQESREKPQQELQEPPAPDPPRPEPQEPQKETPKESGSFIPEGPQPSNYPQELHKEQPREEEPQEPFTEQTEISPVQPQTSAQEAAVQTGIPGTPLLQEEAAAPPAAGVPDQLVWPDWSAFWHTVEQCGKDLEALQHSLLGYKEQYALLKEPRKEKPLQQEPQEPQEPPEPRKETPQIPPAIIPVQPQTSATEAAGQTGIPGTAPLHEAAPPAAGIPGQLPHHVWEQPEKAAVPSFGWPWFYKSMSEINQRQAKYWRDSLRKEKQKHQERKQKHQQELRGLKQEIPQQEEQPAEADLAAGGVVAAQLLQRALCPADTTAAGFAGQGRNAQ